VSSKLVLNRTLNYIGERERLAAAGKLALDRKISIRYGMAPPRMAPKNPPRMKESSFSPADSTSYRLAGLRIVSENEWVLGDRVEVPEQFAGLGIIGSGCRSGSCRSGKQSPD
jgi:hypothetical protein